MKKALFASLFSLSTSIAFSQEGTKIQLQKGQVIKITSKDSSFVSNTMGGETNDMTSVSKSYSTLTVADLDNKRALCIAKLDKIHINFDGFGQKMEYDSQDPSKQNSPMASTLKDKIAKPDTLLYDAYGKAMDAPDKAEAKKGKGRGLMRMMNQGSGYTENMFLSIPSEVVLGKGWKTDNSKNDIKSQTIYFYDKLEGDIATVSFKKKTKGIMNNEMQGMQMTIELDNLSEGELTVNVKTGRVIKFKEITQSNTKSNPMGRETTSKGTTVSELTFE